MVIRHPQPLQFSDSDFPLCCEATSPITSPQPSLSSGHSSLDVPDSPGWRVAPHWRSLKGLAGKGFSVHVASPGRSCVTVFSGHTFFLDKVPYAISLKAPQRRTLAFSKQRKDSHRSRDFEPLLLRVMMVVMPAWEGDSGGGCGESSRYGEEKKYGRREVAITAVYILITRTF